MRNIPPITNTDLLITRPEIYFGQLTDRYVLVNALEKEFDYPSGDDNVESIYEGSDGIKLNGIKRLLFAIDQRSMQLLVSNNITADSRILLNRNVLTRVQKIAPFLTYDASPYIVVNQEDGKLYWIIDAYTTSNQYPYSEASNFNGREVSYIRNSVKVVVDAYEGTTTFYVYDDNDPVIQTYASIFPDLFKEQTEFPTGLAAHVKYPTDYFQLQSRILRKYHVNNPMVFYNGEDLWDIAQEKYMGNVFVVLTARTLNKDIYIISRAVDKHAPDKLKRAGANRTISTNEIGGRRMAAQMLRPSVVSFLEVVTSIGNEQLDLQDVDVTAQSEMDGKELRDLRIPDRFGLVVIATKKAGQANMTVNPKSDLVLNNGDLILVLGNNQQVGALRKIAGDTGVRELK